MGNGFTSLLFSVGFSCWLYYKIMEKTGGNTGTATKATIGAGLAMFLFIYTLLKYVLGV